MRTIVILRPQMHICSRLKYASRCIKSQWRSKRLALGPPTNISRYLSRLIAK